MQTVFFLFFLLLVHSANAVICKIVAEDGSVSYSDTPETECENRVDLPDYSHYEPRPIPAPVVDKNVSKTTNKELSSSNHYREVSVLQPGPGQTVRNNEGTVTVSVAVTPALRKSDRVRVLLDGVAIQPDSTSQSLTLSEVGLGSHNLLVQIVDGAGTVLASSASVQFFLHRISTKLRRSTTPDADASDSASSANPGFRNNTTNHSYQPNYAPR